MEEEDIGDEKACLVGWLGRWCCSVLCFVFEDLINNVCWILATADLNK